MLRKLPGVFVAGEMIDWEAPTGGYLLQGCFATGTEPVALLRSTAERKSQFDDRYSVPPSIRRCATTSISAVCGNMSRGVIETTPKRCCNSAMSRASVGGLHDT